MVVWNPRIAGLTWRNAGKYLACFVEPLCDFFGIIAVLASTTVAVMKHYRILLKNITASEARIKNVGVASGTVKTGGAEIVIELEVSTIVGLPMIIG